MYSGILNSDNLMADFKVIGLNDYGWTGIGYKSWFEFFIDEGRICPIGFSICWLLGIV